MKLLNMGLRPKPRALPRPVETGLRSRASSFVITAAFVALIHCGEDEGLTIECTVANDGGTCDCTPGTAVIGFCNVELIGPPAACCAQPGWPGAGTHCGCDRIDCVSLPGRCKCTRHSQRIQPSPGEAVEDVAECPIVTNTEARCCVDTAGNCGCYLRTNGQCGEGAVEVDKCDFFKVAATCPAGETRTNTCEE